MKKVLLSLMMSVILSYAFSQNVVNFTIDSEGDFHVPNSEKDYYVFNFPGKSAAQLYTMALKAANRTFNGTEDEIKKVPNRAITVMSSFENTKYSPLGDSKRTIFYVFDVDFKAGRIRITAPRIPKIYNTNSFIGDDETEYPFSYIQISNADIMNTWFVPMNKTINKMLSAMSDKNDENW